MTEVIVANDFISPVRSQAATGIVKSVSMYKEECITTILATDSHAQNHLGFLNRKCC